MTTKTNYEILLELQKENELKSLIRRGIIPGKYLLYLQCYQSWLSLSELYGPTEAIYQMEVAGPYSSSTLWRIIRFMQSIDPKST